MKSILKILTFSFLVNQAYAVCDFPVMSFNGHYYTHVETAMTWDSANTYAQSIGGYMAIPNDVTENGWFISQGWKENWIGLYDPLKLENYCNLGAANCVADDSRFRTSKGGAITYKNWEANEPNNLVLPEDYDQYGNPIVNPLGEHWVLIGSNGKWGDYGNHANSYKTNFKAKAIIEFDNAPACHGADANSTVVLPDQPFCIADANGDGTGQPDEINDCTPSSLGFMCNADQSICQPKYKDANCTNGGVLEPDRDMCQIDGAIECPIDYTFDETTDLCYKEVSCPTPTSCKGDYTAWNFTECRKEPICPTGTVFNSNRDRCEVEVSCPAGTTYNSSSGFCQYTATTELYAYRWSGIITFTVPSNAIVGEVWDTTQRVNDKIYTAYKADGTSITGDWAGNGLDTGQNTLRSQFGATHMMNIKYGTASATYHNMPLQSLKKGNTFTKTPLYKNSCPNGGTLSSNVCRIAPTCPSSAPLRDGSTCYNSASCTDGGQLDNSTDQCVLPLEGGYSGPLGQCIAQWSGGCAAGYVAIGDTCQAEPVCPAGTTYNPNLNRCEMPPLSACPSGYTYNSSTSFCEYTPPKTITQCKGSIDNISFSTSPGGIASGSGYKVYFNSNCIIYKSQIQYFTLIQILNLNLSYGQSNASVYTIRNTTNPCPTGSSWTGSQCLSKVPSSCSTTSAPLKDGDICYNSASCLSSGALNNTIDKCELPFVKDCPAGTTYDATRDECLGAADCGPGTLDTNTSRCIIENTVNQNTCPEGYSYSPFPIGKCEAIPICLEGTYIAETTSIPKPFNNTIDHNITDKCYAGDNACPYGDQYMCDAMPSKNNNNYCSPWACTDSSGASFIGSPLGTNDKKNDGAVTEQGCTGTVYIFNGKDERCRADDAFFGLTGGGCCNKDKVFAGLVSCDEKEKILAGKRKKDLCHHVGTYCSKEISLGFTDICVQHKESHCCFNSMLGRIIQEQGRPQLNISWGIAEAPNCRGFKAVEFEKLDFSRIDFTEYEQTVSANTSIGKVNQVQAGAKMQIQNKVSNLVP